MKNEAKVKKLVLRKETLRDLTAHHAGKVKGGAATKGHGQKCSTGVKVTVCGYGCPTYYSCTCLNCTMYTCNFTCHPC